MKVKVVATTSIEDGQYKDSDVVSLYVEGLCLVYDPVENKYSKISDQDIQAGTIISQGIFHYKVVKVEK